VYIAMVERMDQCMGRVLDTLEEIGVAERTLVMFASDNGGTQSSRNAPLRGHKGSTFEGGIRVPCIIRWPGVVPGGVTSDQVCITFDLTATIAGAAGVEPSPEKPFEGIDIVKHVADAKPDIDRTLFWRKPREATVWRGVRDGSLKFVSDQQADDTETHLFDLSNDIGERHDLIDQRPEDALRLQRLFDEWEESTRRNRRGRPN
jgi:N-acetylgalactosamine-6-sulfatase